MSTLQEQILQQLKLALTGIPGVQTCERSRKTGLDRDETAAILIRPDVEQDERFSDRTDKHMFTAVITVSVRGDPWDEFADPFVEEVHKRVMTDATLNGMAMEIRRTAREPESTEADATAGQYELHYRFTYLSLANSLSAQP